MDVKLSKSDILMKVHLRSRQKLRGYTCWYILNAYFFVWLVKAFPCVCVGRYGEPLHL